VHPFRGSALLLPPAGRSVAVGSFLLPDAVSHGASDARLSAVHPFQGSVSLLLRVGVSLSVPSFPVALLPHRECRCLFFLQGCSLGRERCCLPLHGCACLVRACGPCCQPPLLARACADRVDPLALVLSASHRCSVEYVLRCLRSCPADRVLVLCGASVTAARTSMCRARPARVCVLSADESVLSGSLVTAAPSSTCRVCTARPRSRPSDRVLVLCDPSVVSHRCSHEHVPSETCSCLCVGSTVRPLVIRCVMRDSAWPHHMTRWWVEARASPDPRPSTSSTAGRASYHYTDERET
jgi:hypothetical protein